MKKSEVQEQLEFWLSQPSSLETKQKIKRLKRKLRRINGPRANAEEGTTQRPPPTMAELKTFREQVIDTLLQAGLQESSWGLVDPKYPPYCFDLYRAYQYHVETEQLLTKFQARWGVFPKWFILGQQGEVPLLLLGPTGFQPS